jgi:hypothetical protein
VQGPWTSASTIALFGTLTKAAPAGPLGKWTPLINFPLVPVAAAALPNNKVRRVLCAEYVAHVAMYAVLGMLMPRCSGRPASQLLSGL